VLSVFQAYRVVVLPVANTWMSWSLLNKMSVTPSWGVVAVLGLILLACIIMGMQVRSGHGHEQNTGLQESLGGEAGCIESSGVWTFRLIVWSPDMHL
jgi:hypothetical protein